jgi:hypothetical protein
MRCFSECDLSIANLVSFRKWVIAYDAKKGLAIKKRIMTCHVPIMIGSTREATFS